MTYPAQPPYQPPMRRHISVLAIISMILSIIGIPLVLCLFLGVPLCFVGLILGIIALVRIKSRPDTLGSPINTPGTIAPIVTESAPWDTILVPVRDSSGNTQ